MFTPPANILVQPLSLPKHTHTSIIHPQLPPTRIHVRPRALSLVHCLRRWVHVRDGQRTQARTAGPRAAPGLANLRRREAVVTPCRHGGFYRSGYQIIFSFGSPASSLLFAPTSTGSRYPDGVGVGVGWWAAVQLIQKPPKTKKTCGAVAAQSHSLSVDAYNIFKVGVE